MLEKKQTSIHYYDILLIFVIDYDGSVVFDLTVSTFSTDGASTLDWYSQDWYFQGACALWPWLVLY